MVGGDDQIGGIEPGLHIGIRMKHNRRPGVLQESRLCRRRLHHAAVGGQIAPQHECAAGPGQRFFNRQDHVVGKDLGAGDVFAERATIGGQAVERETVAQPGEQGGHAPGVVEIFHQVFASGPQVGNHRHSARHPIEIVKRQWHARPPR